jgi:outer membrane protein OmpA-like peptidoglycan-associated protein
MLNNDARNILNRFIASGKIRSVGFFGHTDQSGRTEYNEWLSVQRALAVKDYLLSKGLKQDNVSVVRGFGAERLITKDPDSASQQLNRRVTITNAYKPTTTDIAAVAKQTPIYYTSSPAPILTDSSAVSLTVSTKQTSANNKSNLNTDRKENEVSNNGNTDVKEVLSDRKAEGTKSSKKDITAIPTNRVEPIKKPKDTNTAKTKNDKTTESQTAVKTEVSGEMKESFADRLSKAINKPSTKPSNTAEKPANSSSSPVVKQQKHEKLIEDIKDNSTKEGEHIVLRHIHFYGGRHAFLPQAYPALDDLLETMQKVPTLKIEIQGHICCQDGEGDQIDFDSGEPVLSVTRAKAVYDFLLENGIDKSRMTYKGLAHKFPIVKVETNEEEATINRRVEIKIIKK